MFRAIQPAAKHDSLSFMLTAFKAVRSGQAVPAAVKENLINIIDSALKVDFLNISPGSLDFNPEVIQLASVTGSNKAVLESIKYILSSGSTADADLGQLKQLEALIATNQIEYSIC